MNQYYKWSNFPIGRLKWFGIALLLLDRDLWLVWKKKQRHFLNQSDEKLKQISTESPAFSRASRLFHVFALSSWIIFRKIFTFFFRLADDVVKKNILSAGRHCLDKIRRRSRSVSLWRVPYLSANLRFFPVIGRFLCSMLEIVMRWHGDKKTYDKVFLFCCCICLSCHVIHLKFSNFFICYHLSFQSLLVSQTWPFVCTRSLKYVHKQTLIGKTFSLECVVILHIV